MFQSLFWWILYCDDLNENFIVLFIGVSILVLVDLILWRYKRNAKCNRLLVSILVLVDLILWRPLNKCQELHPGVSILVLVDLILWHCWWWRTRNFWWVSILVLVDLILWLNNPKEEALLKDEFQSLFWWILYCDKIDEVATEAAKIRFNPCFGGSYIVTKKTK